ncbi:hypothetical protein FOA52_005622 [Chlamydomonas sp. UWO 241]|nr:hypothetical protein FOA52_005622 [Chlamydomonas sp. UWO 241]
MGDHYLPEEGNTDTAALAVFPYCRCDEYRCAGGPYEVVPTVVENVTADTMRMCWKFVYKGCQINSPCCQKQIDDVDKIEFDSGTSFQCDKTVVDAKLLLPSGELRNEKGGIQFDTEFATAKFRIAKLEMLGRANIEGAVLCINTVCDCASIFEPNTRWRFNWRDGVEHEGSVIYRYTVSTVPECTEASYRNAYCCDSTLDEIEIAIDPAYEVNYWQVFTYFYLYDTDGTIMQQGTISTQQKSLLGLIWRFAEKTVEQVPFGQELTLTLYTNPSYWNNTNAFPCGPSMFVNESGVCDYQLHGSQVRDGVKLEDSLGQNIAACCPQGVYVEKPDELCGCVDNKLDSPYRLTAYHPVSSPDDTTTFLMEVVGDLDETLPSVDCTTSDLDAIRIYISPAYKYFITGAVYMGVSVNYTIGSDSGRDWIQLHDLLLVPTPKGAKVRSLRILTSSGAASPYLCGANGAGTALCEYVFYGMWDAVLLDYACCAHGLSETTAPLPPAAVEGHQCDTNAQNSPYHVELGTITYDQAADQTYALMHVKYATAGCVAGGDASCCGSDLKAVYFATLSPVVSASTSPDVGASFVAMSGGVNVTAGFGAGTNVNVVLVFGGSVGSDEVCPAATGCSYRLYGGTSFNRAYCCCATDYTWSPAYTWSS